MENNVKLQLNGRNGGLTFALFIASYILVSILGQLVVGAICGVGTTAYKVLCSAFSPACVLILILFFMLYGKQKLVPLTSVKPFKARYLVFAILLSAGMFLGLGFANDSIAKIIRSLGLNAGGMKIPMPTIWHFLSYLVVLVILPAIFEEVLFRGILLNCFAGMKRVFAVLISAFIFAIYHQSLTQFIYQFIYGVALGYLALSAKSIIPCMVAHFANNFTVLLLNYLKVSVDLFNPIYLVIGANLLAFFGAIVFFIQRKAEKSQAVKGELKGFFLPFGLITIIACLAIAIGRLLGV